MLRGWRSSTSTKEAFASLWFGILPDNVEGVLGIALNNRKMLFSTEGDRMVKLSYPFIERSFKTASSPVGTNSFVG